MTTDILVIGTGISGLTYAIKIALLSPKKRIILICKSSLDEGNTKYAQGGIAVVSNFKKDSYEKHINDTLIAGAGMCNKKVVDFVVKEGGKRLKELIDWGTEFDKKKQNKFDLGREGGHSAQRIVHHKDHSGSEIIRALIEKIKGLKNIKYLENHLLVDLITDHHMISAPKRCYGAYVISITDQKIIKITSKISILSTGGAGQLFEFTTNPNSIDLYELKEPNFPNDFEKRDNFFWMSPYAFKIAIKLYPSILKKHHSCGMGNSFEQIKEIITNEEYLTPYLSYEHWLNKVENKNDQK